MLKDEDVMARAYKIYKDQQQPEAKKSVSESEFVMSKLLPGKPLDQRIAELCENAEDVGEVLSIPVSFKTVGGSHIRRLLTEMSGLYGAALQRVLKEVEDNAPEVDLSPITAQLQALQVSADSMLSAFQDYLDTAKQNAELENEVLMKLKAKLG